MHWLEFLFYTVCMVVIFACFVHFCVVFAQRPRPVRDADGHWRAHRGPR